MAERDWPLTVMDRSLSFRLVQLQNERREGAEHLPHIHVHTHTRGSS